jgi:SRSO17 transposase
LKKGTHSVGVARRYFGTAERIETCFETAKDELGLDHCDARSWHRWHRHMALVMAVLAFLAKLRADLLRASMAEPAPEKRNETSLRLAANPS